MESGEDSIFLAVLVQVGSRRGEEVGPWRDVEHAFAYARGRSYSPVSSSILECPLRDSETDSRHLGDTFDTMHSIFQRLG